MTDAFTKYAEIGAIHNKEAATVARALFERWICHFGCPIEFTSDNGKEFCNELTKELFKLLQIKHLHTTPYHPQCNAQAEVQNKVLWVRQLASCRSTAKNNADKLSTCHNENYSKNLTLADCLLKLQNHNKNIFHKSQILNCLPFSNLTRPTTTTTPKPTTYPYYPFAPSRAPYHGTTAPPRHTRQVVATVALVSGVLGTFLGLFNNREINDIQNNLLTLTD